MITITCKKCQRGIEVNPTLKNGDFKVLDPKCICGERTKVIFKMMRGKVEVFQ